MTWNGHVHPFYCIECHAFVRVTAVWLNGLEEVVRVEGICWRHGEVVVEGWSWDDLFPEPNMRVDTPAPLTPNGLPPQSSRAQRERNLFSIPPARSPDPPPPARPMQGARPALME